MEQPRCRMSGASRWVVLLGALWLAGCGSSSHEGPRPHFKVGQPYKINGQWYRPQMVESYEKVGIASWYGSAFHGRPTANGEIFDMYELTAAHPTLPLPSLVRVTNLENGRSLVLRVNDRGPFVANRLIDLSKGAAQELGFESKGLAKVRVEFMGLARLEDARLEPARPAAHQVAALD